MILIINLFAFSVFAEETTENPSYEIQGQIIETTPTPSLDEQYLSLKQMLVARNASAEEFEALDERIAQIKAIDSAVANGTPIPLITPRTYFAILATHISQTTSYNCGPASIQMAAKAANSSFSTSASTQAAIANYVNCTTGTTYSNLLRGLNYYAPSHTWIQRNVNSVAGMEAYCYSTLNAYNTLPIFHMTGQPDGMPYAVSRGTTHYFCAYGYFNENVLIVDPWLGYNGNWYGNDGSEKYECDMDQLLTAMRNADSYGNAVMFM